MMDENKNASDDSSSTTLSASSYVYIGNKRKKNEDNVFFDGRILNPVNAQKPFMSDFTGRSHRFFAFAVCDGMGGENAGELAAYVGVKCFRQWCGKAYRTGIKSWDKECCDFFREANDRVTQLSKETQGKPGCTCSVIVFENGTAYFANVGDSRIYLLRDGLLTQLTTDHTLAEQYGGQREAGGNALTRYLGFDNSQYDFQPSIGIPLRLCPGDVFLLCSDGLTDMLSNETIQSIIQRYCCISLKKAVEHLMKAAMHAGGYDNCSIILIRNDSNPEMTVSYSEQEAIRCKKSALSELMHLALICLFLIIGIIINLLFYFLS